MTQNPYPLNKYLKKILNSFFPKFLFRLSPNRYWARNHWKAQKSGDIHGYDKYCNDHPAAAVVLSEIIRLAKKDASILDIGCNCGYYLNRLKKEGYSCLTGVDICKEAIEFGKKHYDLSGIELLTGSFEDILPSFVFEGRKFNILYSVGATIELVHPSFDIIRHLCVVSNDYIILIISLWGHDYPRFWEYEFNSHGFILEKMVTPYNGSPLPVEDPVNINSLLVFRKVHR